MSKIISFFKNRNTAILSVFSFLIPFTIYLLTLEHKLVGGDTSWYALQIMEMRVFVPTGYPVFSMLGKIMALPPIGDAIFRLNLFSAIFGALTVLFLFLTIKSLVKNIWISFFSALIFAFISPFWSVANMLEFDTLNSFFMVLVIYSAIIYNLKRQRKFLYFFFFCLGLSLTNHPITLFVVPAFLIYVIIINPGIFKSIKAVLTSILLFILPLLSYFYILIRSLQGYGEVTTLKRLLFYVTGRSVTGQVHGGSFGNKSLEVMVRVLNDYIEIIYESFGIVLVAVAIIGFIYLLRKNLRFGLLSFLAMIFNLIIIVQYLDFANPNYVLDSMLIITIYIAFGFMLIFDLLGKLFTRLLAGRKQVNADKVLKYLAFTALILFIAFQPASLIYANYNRADRSEPEEVYKFWDEAIGNIENGSRLYEFASSINVGMFVNKYEYGEKGIEFIYHNDEGYSVESIEADIGKGIDVYLVGNAEFLRTFLEIEQVGKTYYWDWQKEVLRLFKVKGLTVNIDISHNIDSYDKKFSEIFMLEYVLRNNNKNAVNINSIELELPDSLELVGIEPGGYIDQGPGMSRGMYMWVSDEYVIEGSSEINLKVNLRGTIPGRSAIKFRVSTSGRYIESEDIEIEVKP